VRWQAPWGVQASPLGWFPTFWPAGLHLATSVTNDDGFASVDVTLGKKAGTYGLTASVDSKTVEFEVSATSGAPTLLGWTWYSAPFGYTHPAGFGSYGTRDVGITNISFAPMTVVSFDAYGNVASLSAPMEWTVLSGSGTITQLGETTAVVTPHADGPLVFRVAPSTGSLALTDTIYGAAAIMLTMGSGDGHCEEGTFLPPSVTISAGRWVAWAVCDDGESGWELEGDEPTLTDEWIWTYEHDVTFEDGVVVWPSTTDDWSPHFRVFTQPGTYRFRCTLHSTGFDNGEVGEVIVE
jgi:plastocyanin